MFDIFVRTHLQPDVFFSAQVLGQNSVKLKFHQLLKIASNISAELHFSMNSDMFADIIVEAVIKNVIF